MQLNVPDVRVDYDGVSDVLYITFGSSRKCFSQDVNNIILRYDQNHSHSHEKVQKLNGITIVDASRKITGFNENERT